MAKPHGALEPPFHPTPKTNSLVFHPPASIVYKEALVRPKDGKSEMGTYLKVDLSPNRLDKIYRHLHYAGAPRFARPLHRQRLLSRELTITEDISEHLTWHQSKSARLYLKPLRAYLFSEAFWREHLCSDVDLHKSACGFLLSYVWLISWESDFHIAKEMKLVPNDLEWEPWTEFVHSFTGVINTKSLHQVHRRYQYGELRLSRLNRIYRYSPTTLSLRNLFRGFMTTSSWYQDVFRDNFGWILAPFAILSVTLSAMQVGLGTHQLSNDSAFHAASYGFSVFSLVALAACIGIMLCSWFVLLVYFYTVAKMYHHKVQSARRAASTPMGA